MLKKRSRWISLLLIAILALFGPSVVKAERAKAYAVCENRMRSIPSYDGWVYQRTEFNLGLHSALWGPNLYGKTGLVFHFNGCGEVACSVYRDLSGWHIGTLWEGGGSCLPE